MTHDHTPPETMVARRESLRQLLESRRREVLGKVQTTRRDVSSATEIGQHEVRDVVDESEMDVRIDVNLALLEIRSELVARIDESLARLAEDRYGSCAECGGEIALARLAALPFAVRCTSCEQAREHLSRRREAAIRSAGDWLQEWRVASSSNSRF